MFLTYMSLLRYVCNIRYLHAEGYSGGALKHGPFALIEGKEGKNGPTPIIMIVLDDEFGSQMRIAAEEVKARGAEVNMDQYLHAHM
jgi:glucosamine 6-phosphate synthetase-like amidotransferase/phosphosugar isomerase protein